MAVTLGLRPASSDPEGVSAGVLRVVQPAAFGPGRRRCGPAGQDHRDPRRGAGDMWVPTGPRRTRSGPPSAGGTPAGRPTDAPAPARGRAPAPLAAQLAGTIVHSDDQVLHRPFESGHHTSWLFGHRAHRVHGQGRLRLRQPPGRVVHRLPADRTPRPARLGYPGNWRTPCSSGSRAGPQPTSLLSRLPDTHRVRTPAHRRRPVWMIT